MFNKLFSGRVPEQEEIDDLRAEIEEARRIHDYTQAKKLQKKLQKIERKASKGKPTARSMERKDSTRRIVPFDALSEGGIMRRDAGHYQCAIEVDDVNYIAARAAEQEDVRILWGDYLNSLDHNIEVHIYLDNHKVDDEVFLKSLKMSPVAGDSDGNVLRAEFDAYCRDKLNGSSRAMRRTRTVVITVAADTREKAAPVLTREAERLIRTMRDLESDARMLSGQDWLDRITTHTHPDDAEGVIDLRESARAVGIGSRDLAAPSSIVRIGERADDSRMLVAGRRWVQSYVMTLEGYGNSMRDTFITDLARLPYDISVSWHIKPWATDVAISAAERHLREITEENDNYKMSRSRPERGYFIDDENLPSSMRDARDEAQAYRDDLVRNDERNFSIVTVVTAEAKDEEELDEACKQIEAVFSVHRKPKPDSWGNLREQMYTASLPIGVCDLPYARTLTTEPLSHMIMWASAELMDDGGMIMGINPTTNAFETYDPTRYEHTNSFTFGQPGSGKSMTAKLTRIIQTHLRHPDDDVIIIDPENEYAAVTQKLGGQVIDIHEGSPDHINPLDISASYGAENPDTVSDPVPAKVSFLQALVHMMASSITDTQKNLLDQAGKYVYAAWQQDQRPENIPTLRDVYDYLNAIEGEVAPDAHHLATLIKRYVVGTLNAFAHPTNVDIDNHLVDLVFSKISRELRPIAMLCILDHIWVRVTANRATGRRTWLIIDEFQLLLDDEFAVDQIDRYFTRGRKWNLYNLAITQSLSRMLDNRTTRYMLQNCPYITIMNQTTEAAREAAEMFGLSDTQERLIHSSGPGQGLYVLKNAVVPFDLTIDRRVCPELYSLVTTRPSDVKRAQSARKADPSPEATTAIPIEPSAPGAPYSTEGKAWGEPARDDQGPANEWKTHYPTDPSTKSWLSEDDGSDLCDLDEPETVASPVETENRPRKAWEGFATIDRSERTERGVEETKPATPASDTGIKADGGKAWLEDAPEDPATPSPDPEPTYRPKASYATERPRRAWEGFATMGREDRRDAREDAENSEAVDEPGDMETGATKAWLKDQASELDDTMSEQDPTAEPEPVQPGRPWEGFATTSGECEEDHGGILSDTTADRGTSSSDLVECEGAHIEAESRACDDADGATPGAALPMHANELEESAGRHMEAAEHDLETARLMRTAAGAIRQVAARQDAKTIAQGPEPQSAQTATDPGAERQYGTPSQEDTLLVNLAAMMERQKEELGGMIEGKIVELNEKSDEIADKLGQQDERIERLERMCTSGSRDDAAQDEGRVVEGDPQPGNRSQVNVDADNRRAAAFNMSGRRDLFLALQLSRAKGSNILDDLDSMAANDRGPGPSSGMIEPIRREAGEGTIFTDDVRTDG